MTKILKPWRLITIGGIVYQTRPKEIGCQGCDRDSINLCPRIVDKRYEEPEYDCSGVILKKIQQKSS